MTWLFIFLIFSIKKNKNVFTEIVVAVILQVFEKHHLKTLHSYVM